MKKVMICAMILLPLIILLIMSVSGVIVNSTTYLYVENIAFVDDEITLQKNSEDSVTYQLLVNILPKFANNKQVAYWSDNENIASVSETGVVTGKEFGETYVYVKSKENETKVDACKVIVTDNKIHQIKIDNAISTMHTYSTYRLITTIYPTEVDNPKLIYTSSNSSIIKVSADGELTTKDALGSAVITIYSEANPAAKVELEIIVSKKIEGMTIADSAKETTASLTYSFPEITFYPVGSSSAITYSSSSEDIATVDKDGNVEFKKAGTVTITATAEGGISVSKTIKSTAGYYDYFVFDNSVINIDYVENGILDIKYTATPYNADSSLLVFTSSNTNVIKVANKKFYIVGGGTATITAAYQISSRSTHTTKCTVNVSKKAEKIAVFDSYDNETNYIVTQKSAIALKSQVVPADATYSNFSCSVDNESVCRINNGVLYFTKDEYTSVNVKFSIDGEIENVVKYVYIPSKFNPSYVGKGNKSAILYMPSSNLTQEIYVAPFIQSSLVNKVEYFVDDSNITLNNEILLVKDTKPFNLTIKVNGEDYATVSYSVERKVERLDNVEFFGIDGSTKELLSVSDGKIYTGFKEISVSYNVYPLNATQTKSQLSIVGDSAIEQNGNILFSKSGSISLCIEVGDAKYNVTIQSTCGLFDKNTQLKDSIILNALDNIDAKDLFNTYSPVSASLDSISLTSNSDILKINDDKSISAVHGGDAIISVDLLTQNGKISKEIYVHIHEVPTAINLNNNYCYTEEDKINLLSVYSIEPLTSNYNNAVTYTIIEGNSIASISNSFINFTDNGLVRVQIETENGIKNVVSFINYASLELIEAIDDIIDYEINKPFALRLPNSILQSATYLDSFNKSGSVDIINGAIINLNSVTSDKNSNASVSFSGETFNLRGIIKASSVSISLVNSLDADLIIDNSYITGLKQIELTASIAPINATNDEIEYIVSDSSIASMNSNTLVFSKEGEVEVTAINKDGIKSSIKIYSTYGKIKSISLKENSLTYEFDNDNSLNNIKDLSSIIDVYPSQIVLSNENINISISKDIASIDCTILTLKNGGNCVASIRINKEEVVTATISITIERAANLILIDNVDISTLTADVQENDSSLKLFKLQTMPLDATKNMDINIEIVSGGAYATLSGNSLRFSKINENIKVKFTLGSGDDEKSWIVTYLATSLIEIVDIDNETVVAPSNERFSFYSNKGDTFSFVSSTIALTENGENDYSYNSANIGKIVLKINGSNVEKDFYITSRVYEITGVKINDVENSVAKSISISNNGLFETASKSLSVSYDNYDYALNSDGTKPSISFTQSDDMIATFANGNISFKTNGEATFTITINGSDYYGVYSTEYTFKVYSSFGIVDDFSIINPYESGVIVDNIQGFDLSNYITPTMPKYGVLSPNYTFLSSDDKIISVDNNGKVSFVGSGVASISVKTVSGRGDIVVKSISIKVDKYIDAINVVDNQNTIYQDATNDLTYPINVELLSSSNVKPTLLNVSYEVKSGDATVNDEGLITFTSDNTKCVIGIYADLGSSETFFTIFKLGNDTKIYSVNDLTSTVAVDINKTVFINTQFSDGFVEYDVSSNSNFEVINSTVNSFKGLIGSENILSFIGTTKEINLIVMQDIDNILFKAGAPDDSYLIAEDNLDIIATYGANITPQTATDENGLIKISYSVNNLSGTASIQDGKLVFTKQGIVEIVFTAGNIVKTKKVESTMYYASSVTFPSGLKTVFEYSDGEYGIPVADCSVLPLGATKQNIFFTSSNENIFKIENNKIVFTGGGYANLELNYYVKENVYNTVTCSIFVNNRAKSIVAKDGDDVVGYIVKNSNFTLEYMISFDGKTISNYSISYVSKDTSIATISSKGLIEFLQKDKAVTFTISVVNEYDSQIDCSCDVVVISSSKLIQKVYDGSSIVVEYDAAKNTILYPIANISDSQFAYSITAGSDVLSINSLTGEITPLKGGNASLLVESTNASLQVNVFIHKVVSDINFANALITNTPYVTSKTYVELGTYINPVDAAYNKEITYEYDNSIATIDSNGNITFIKAGVLNITVKALYDGDVECVKNVTIQSSFNDVISFDVLNNSNSLASNYTLSNIGESIVFNVNNIYPSDYQGTLTASAKKEDVHSVNVSSNVVTVTGLAKGSGDVVFSMGSVKYTTNINVLLKSTSVVVYFEDSQVSEIKTLLDSIKISALVYPLDASNPNYSYSIDGGASIDSNGNISLSGCSYGTYNVTVSASDGGSSTTIKVVYLEDISGVEVQNNGNILNENDTVHLKWNETEVVLTLNAIPKIVGVDYSLFTMTSVNGSTGNMSNNSLIIQTLPVSSNPAFEDTITIKYKSIISYVVKISRFGVKSVDFGDHNATKDALCGYQEIRLTGNKSYYDGEVQNYYKMPFNVNPSSLYSKIIWDSTYKNVTVTSCNGYAMVYLNLVSTSSRDQISQDNFSAGEFTLYAKDDEGNILAQYAYHVVDGTNVFDQAGFVNGGSSIVLQTNFGHDDEASSISNGTAVRLDTVVTSMPTIYGNGHLLNLQANNATFSSDVECVNVYMSYMYNLSVKGSNNSSDMSNYHVEFVTCYDFAYCEVYNFYRPIHCSSVKVKKSVFRSIYLECINLAGTSTYHTYLEDVIIFDGGATALEAQCGDYYIKGFLDVYNFQCKDALSRALADIKIVSSLVMSLITSGYADYYIEKNGDKYANIVVYSNKSTAPEGLYFYDKTTNSYIQSADGIPGCCEGLHRMQKEVNYLFDKLLITLWVYPADKDGYPKYSDQYKDDGTLNYECLANTAKKVQRSWRINNPL